MEEEIQEPTLDEASDKALKKLNSEPEQKPEPIVKDESPKPSDKDGSDKPVEKEPEFDEKTLADLRDGKIIPKHRLDEVSQRLKGYESLGTPEELQAKLAEIAKAKPEVLEKDKPKPDSDLSQEDKETRDYLHKLFPFLKDAPKLEETLRGLMTDKEERKAAEERQTEERWNKNVDAGMDRIKTLATEKNIDVSTPIKFNLVCRGVTGVLNQDQKLHDRFYKDGDLNAVKEAFDIFDKEFISGVQRGERSKILSDKKLQEKLPKAPLKGGHEDEKPKDPSKMTLDEVGDNAWEKVNA